MMRRRSLHRNSTMRDFSMWSFPWTRIYCQRYALLSVSEMGIETVRLLKCGEAAVPFAIVAEMLKTAGPRCFTVLTQLLNIIVVEGHIPSDRNESFIVNLFKGKGDSESLERSNFRGLKLLPGHEEIRENIAAKLPQGMHK